MSRSYKKAPYYGDKKGKDKKRIANHAVRNYLKDIDKTLSRGSFKKIFCSYSMSGILIMEAQIKNKKEYESEIKIEPIFNIYGGATKDKLKISFKSDKKTINEYYIFYKVFFSVFPFHPFFVFIRDTFIIIN